MVTVESIEELERAINPRTAMIYLMADSGPNAMLESVARIAGPKNIPILVDAAAEVLTIPNVHLQRGATIVAYSGGKASAVRSARDCCSDGRTSCSPPGRPVRRITARDATTKWDGRRPSACWRRSKRG
jgi:Selenocysteine synthase [seryl-tRNASer selenium transferase]